MKVAIMQPYVFPYLGYFQLVHAVDVFVFYDDVNFIKRGWINRNKILAKGEESLFTIPLSGASQNKLINEINILDKSNSQNKFLNTLMHNYKKSPYFNEIFSLVEKVFNKSNRTISDLAISSIVEITNYLEINTSFEISSEKYSETKGLEKSDRLLAITKIKGFDYYVNLMGGIDLYNKDYFKKKGIKLQFINNELLPYKQFKNEPVIGLSIIDVLMFNSKEETIKMIENYKLI